MKAHYAKVYPIVALAAAVMLVTACGGDSSTGPDQTPATSSFTASISGGSSASLKGLATFGTGTDPQTGDQAFGLFLSDTTGGYVYIVREQAGVPPTGTYPLFDATGDATPGPSDYFALALLGPSTSPTAAYTSRSGSFTITSSSANELKGTFTINGFGGSLTAGDTATATITGSFDALGGSVNIPGGRLVAGGRAR